MIDLLLINELEQAYLVDHTQYVHIEYDDREYPSCTFMRDYDEVHNYYSVGGYWVYHYIPDVLRDLRGAK